jgi:hypothetical protein
MSPVHTAFLLRFAPIRFSQYPESNKPGSFNLTAPQLPNSIDVHKKFVPWMSVFVKLRHFPEFHIAVSSLTDLNKSEASLVASQTKLFGDEFRRWARSQKGDDLNPALTEIVQTGIQQVKVNRETAKNLENLGRDLQPLLTQETERSKRRDAYTSAREDAEKAVAAADRAQAAFTRIQNSGKPPDVAKAEAAAQAARAKADRDRDAASALKAQLDETEVIE